MTSAIIFADADADADVKNHADNPQMRMRIFATPLQAEYILYTMCSLLCSILSY